MNPLVDVRQNSGVDFHRVIIARGGDEFFSHFPLIFLIVGFTGAS
jgi:hypothetical protein